jgi:hypothetical protein
MIIPFQRRLKVPDNDLTNGPDPFADLLAYRAEPPAADFVAGVMTQTKRQSRTRRAVLWGTGLAGTLCGALGAAWLSGPISRGMTAAFEMQASMPTALLAVGVGVLVAWFLAEDSSIVG